MTQQIKIGDITRLLESIENYVTGHTGFESSVVIRVVNEELANACDLNTAALVPLKHKIFNFEAALRWGFFLMIASPKLLAESEVVLPNFDIHLYNKTLEDIYDQAVKTAVWDFCYEDEEEEEEEEEEEDEEEEKN